MPYDLHVDHDLRLVIASFRGDVTEADVFAYNDDPTYSDPAIYGYSDLIDMTPVERLIYPLAASLQHFADSSARRDLPGKLAGHLLLVASDDYHFGLARMYQSFRELHPLTQRKVGVFRTRDEALAWLAAERARPAARDGQ